MNSVVAISSDDEFNGHINGCRLCVVDFYATWCGPCHTVAPKFAELSFIYPEATFLKVDVDQFRSLAMKYAIQAMPTFKLFCNGNEMDSLRGGDINRLESMIKQQLTAAKLPDEKHVNIGRSFPCFTDLMNNEASVFADVSKLLLKFCDNIIKDPKNVKYRQIRIENDIFMTRLLPVAGAVDCLFIIGFRENDDKFLHPVSKPLDNIYAMRAALIDERLKRALPVPEPVLTLASQTTPAITTPSTTPTSCTVPSTALKAAKGIRFRPKSRTIQEQQMYNRLRSSIGNVLLYENPELQQLTQEKIPLDRLKNEAKSNAERSRNSDTNPVMDEKDHLLLLLLAWFKNEFFTWMDKPKCSRCDGPTESRGVITPSSDDREWGAQTVENYQCTKCGGFVRFPRYNHPQKLLETRAGRCGEWANCFTLCCRSVGLDARYILDWTDHVWTEVYSKNLKRWLHCDSCENVCDKPLLYEAGWNKKLSYCLAFSKDEIIDVSWRYSANHAEMRSRRRDVSEPWLLNCYSKITKELQSSYSTDERARLLKRSALELIELMIEKKETSDVEQFGRISGSAEWRQDRGEIGATKSEHIFKPAQSHIQVQTMEVSYSSVTDKYYTGGEIDISGWDNGIEKFENIHRKVELDWKKVYLARAEGSTSSSISWKFDLSDSDCRATSVNVRLDCTTYEDGKISVDIIGCDGDRCQRETASLQPHAPSITVSTDKFVGMSSITITARMSGGKGNVAWQHTQLFRKDIEAYQEKGLEVKIGLMKKT